MALNSLKFHVFTGGGTKPWATFAESRSAQQYARWLSTSHKGFTVEVLAPDGVIGQYVHGQPTDEFKGRGDEHYPYVADDVADFRSFTVAPRPLNSSVRFRVVQPKPDYEGLAATDYQIFVQFAEGHVHTFYSGDEAGAREVVKDLNTRNVDWY